MHSVSLYFMPLKKRTLRFQVKNFKQFTNLKISDFDSNFHFYFDNNYLCNYTNKTNRN